MERSEIKIKGNRYSARESPKLQLWLPLVSYWKIIATPYKFKYHTMTIHFLYLNKYSRKYILLSKYFKTSKNLDQVKKEVR